MNFAPIALFVYARPDHVRLTMEALSRNILSSESDLFIFSDAAKTYDDFSQVENVREYIRSFVGFKSITIVEQAENKGLARSIIDGVSTLVNKFGRVIVLEDDIVTSPFFLQYMNEALEKFKDEDQVMHVSGYMFPINQDGLNPTFFLRTTSCWGWATWSRAWRHFEKNASKLVQTFSSSAIRRFNMDDTYDFWSQVQDNHLGKINTWAIFWYASVFQRNGLCLHPSVSLVQNIGIDGSGVNCGQSNSFNTDLSESPVIWFDSNIRENPVALKRLKFFFSRFRPSFFTRLKLSIKKLLKSLHKG